MSTSTELLIAGLERGQLYDAKFGLLAVGVMVSGRANWRKCSEQM